MGGAPPRRDLARHVGVVLDRDGDAEQRQRVARATSCVRPIRLGERLVGEHDTERVQRPVDAHDALDRRLDQLPRRDLPGTDVPGLRCRPGPDHVGLRQGPETTGSTSTGWVRGAGRLSPRPRRAIPGGPIVPLTGLSGFSTVVVMVTP